MDPYSFTMHHVTPKGSIEQQVYLATYEHHQEARGQKGPCVLIGRCADYALRDRDDVINIFVSAPPIESRIKRVAARNNISEAEAKERIKKTDKSRASYYNYYSSKDWGEAKSYDLCIDSSLLLGIEGTVSLLERAGEAQGHEVKAKMKRELCAAAQSSLAIMLLVLFQLFQTCAQR